MNFQQAQQQPQPPHPQQTGGQPMQGTPSWMAQMGQNGVPQMGNNTMLPNQQQVMGMQHASAQLPNQNPNLGSPFNPNLAAAAQSQTPVPRSGPTPQQQNQQHQQQMFQAIMQQQQQQQQQQRQQTSPQPPSGGSVGVGVGMGGPKPQMLIPQGSAPQQAPRTNGITMPPIPRDKFFAVLQDSYQKARTQPNRQLLQIGSRMIDLYQLHTEVLHFGGVANVSLSKPELSAKVILTVCGE